MEVELRVCFPRLRPPPTLPRQLSYPSPFLQCLPVPVRHRFLTITTQIRKNTIKSLPQRHPLRPPFRWELNQAPLPILLRPTSCGRSNPLPVRRGALRRTTLPKKHSNSSSVPPGDLAPPPGRSRKLVGQTPRPCTRTRRSTGSGYPFRDPLGCL